MLPFPREKARSQPINVTSVARPDHEDLVTVVIDLVDDAVVANANPPGRPARRASFAPLDVPFATPLELAKKFVREQGGIACAGWGPDAAYARWLAEVLESTKPNGLYHAFSEDKDPTDRLYTLVARVETVPLPPVGWARKGEFEDH